MPTVNLITDSVIIAYSLAYCEDADVLHEDYVLFGGLLDLFYEGLHLFYLLGENVGRLPLRNLCNYA